VVGLGPGLIRDFANAGSGQHKFQHWQLGTADGQSRVPVFVSMLPSERNAAFAVDQAGNVGRFCLGELVCQFTGRHP
jgi:hypothetical protein